MAYPLTGFNSSVNTEICATPNTIGESGERGPAAESSGGGGGGGFDQGEETKKARIRETLLTSQFGADPLILDPLFDRTPAAVVIRNFDLWWSKRQRREAVGVGLLVNWIKSDHAGRAKGRLDSVRQQQRAKAAAEKARSDQEAERRRSAEQEAAAAIDAHIERLRDLDRNTLSLLMDRVLSRGDLSEFERRRLERTRDNPLAFPTWRIRLVRELDDSPAELVA